MSALIDAPAVPFRRRWRVRLGRLGASLWNRLQASVAGHCRGLAMGLVFATLAGIGLSLYLWAGQRFAPPPVSFMSGGWPLAAQLPMALAFSLIGAVLASRQARNPIGWLFLAIGATSSFVPAVHNMVAAAGNSFVSPGPLTVFLAWLVSSFHLPLVGALLIVVFLVFPDGRVLSARWWNGAVLAVGGALMVGIGLAIDPRGLLWYPLLPNPFAGPAWTGAASDILQLGGLASVLVGLGVASAAMVVRYRAYTPTERRPLKWIAIAIVLLVISGAALMVVRYGLPVSSALGEVVLTATILVAMLLPMAAGIGILRHRLFDIELILNHALVYVPLSGLMTGIYAASVALFQRIFVAVTGDTSDLAIIISTLILASAFTPMRKALEGFVDRHFKPTTRPPIVAASAAPEAATTSGPVVASEATVAPIAAVPAEAGDATPTADAEATMRALVEQLQSVEARLAALETSPGGRARSARRSAG